MNTRLKNILSAMGSVLAIFPAVHISGSPASSLYAKHIAARKTDAQLLSKDWESVGKDLLKAGKSIAL